jgi:oligoribonuclease NrnB/cAMP/cGMP phosphodiesterase (DHH superfamily)
MVENFWRKNRMKFCWVDADLDGVSSYLLIEFFAIKFDMIEVFDYKKRDEDEEAFINKMKEYDDITFIDCSPTQNILSKILGKRISIYDHHDGSEWIKNIKDENLKVFHDQTRCGTKIFFQEYIQDLFPRYPEIIDEYVTLVDTYDMWKIDDLLWESAKDLNYLMYRMFNWSSEKDGYYKYKRFFQSMLKKFDNDEKIIYTDREKELIQMAREKEEEMYIQAKQVMQIRKDSKNKTFGLIYLHSNISVVCSRLLRDMNELDYIICINAYKNYWEKMSCRAIKGKFNTTDLEIFEGHIEASGTGANFSKQDIMDFWTGKIQSLEYKRGL